MEVHRLIGLKKAPGAKRGIEGLRAPLIGRQSELAEIQSAFRKLRNGVGSILAIVGEAGLGKSRLIADAFRSTDIPWAEGRALAYTEGMSYWMARDLLRALLGTDSDPSPEEIEQALRSSIEQIASEKMNEIYPYLGRLLEVPLPAETKEQIKVVTAEALQTRILRAFQDYIRARAARGALILFWEDLHWSDPSSLRVLESLIPLTKEVPLLLLLAYRSDADFVVQLQERARAASAENFRVLELSPLTRKESRSLIQSLLKIENLPEKMRALILDQRGEPVFPRRIAALPAGHGDSRDRERPGHRHRSDRSNERPGNGSRRSHGAHRPSRLRTEANAAKRIGNWTRLSTAGLGAPLREQSRHESPTE